MDQNARVNETFQFCKAAKLMCFKRVASCKVLIGLNLAIIEDLSDVKRKPYPCQSWALGTLKGTTISLPILC